MKEFEEAKAAAREGAAFANGSEYEMWRTNWCDRPCGHDVDYECPLVMVALLGFIPSEWERQPDDRYPHDAYHCTEFREVEAG